MRGCMGAVCGIRFLASAQNVNVEALRDQLLHRLVAGRACRCALCRAATNRCAHYAELPLIIVLVMLSSH